MERGYALSSEHRLADRGLAESPADERRILAAVMRRVGDELGNTPAVDETALLALLRSWRIRRGRISAVGARGPG